LTRTRISKALLAIAVVAPALALGAVHPIALALFTALAGAMLANVALDRREAAHVRLDLVGALLLGLALFTALQLVPLPAGLVRVVSPNAYEIRAGAVAALGRAAPAFMPLTLDATLTAGELAKLLLYAAVYWVSALSTKRYGSGFVHALVVVAGGAAAAVFLAHKILMLDRVYGFYEPIHAAAGAGRLFAPLMNPNHLAGALGLGAAVAIGYAVSAEERSRRIALIGVAGLIGGSLFLTLSRGGMAAFAAGQIVFVALRVLQRRARARGGEEDRGPSAAWLPLGLAISLGLGLFAGQDAILGELQNRDVSKLGILAEGLPLVGDFPATGVGRGAFWVGFSLVSDWSARVTFTHAENAPIQLLADWGVAVGGVALLGFAFAVARRLLRPPPRARAAAAVAALAAFGIHNLVDFNSEIAGVAVLAVALLGALAGSERAGAGRADGARSGAGPVVPRWVLAATAAAALAAAALTGTYAARFALDDEERSLRAALGRGDDAAFAPERVGPVLERHPAAWYPAFLCGAQRFHARRGNPLPLLGRALDLNPAAAPAHFYVGRVLLHGGRLDQALLELRLAARYNPSFAAPAARVLAAAVPRFDEIKRIALDDADRRNLWGAISSALAVQGHPAEAEKADLALIALKPPEPRSVARQVRRLTGRRLYAEALALAERLGTDPESGVARAVLVAEIETAKGSPERAVAALEEAEALRPTDRSLLTALAKARAKAGDLAGALDAVATLKRLASGADALAAALQLEAGLKLEAGRIQEGLAALKQAHVVSPHDNGILRRIADVAEANGDKVRALGALKQLEALEPGNPKWRERVRRIESAARQAGGGGAPR
jgi:tetratricopeptide (TPR) repeat protein